MLSQPCLKLATEHSHASLMQRGLQRQRLPQLVQPLLLHPIMPQAWLTLILKRIANGWPSSDLEALMPWNYEA